MKTAKAKTFILMSVAFALTACGAPAATVTASSSVAAQPIETAAPVDATTMPALHACDGIPTPAQMEGPYYKPGAPERDTLVEAGTVGEPLILIGYVLTTGCEPIEGAIVDVWQADGQGDYDNEGFGLRGRVRTDADGAYRTETVIPGVYPGRTPHIHLKVFAPDGRELLTTQIYLAGLSEQIPDAIFSEDLLARDLPPDEKGRRQIEFDIVVSG